MAASSPAESISVDVQSSSGSSDVESEQEQARVQNRAPKRRRLSESDNDIVIDDANDDDNDEEEKVSVPAPMPTLSRIKRKDPNAQTKPPRNSNNNNDNPELIRDAVEIGLQSAESSFKALNVAPWLIGSLTTMAIRKPTAIQRACIPEILQGRDCIGGSRTGSGKTVAFAVPMCQKWAMDPVGVFGLVLTPTRFVSFSFFLVVMGADCVGNWRCRFSNRHRRFRHRRA